MKAVVATLAVLSFSLTGCLTPITRRLDENSRQLATVSEQLLVVNQQLAALNEQMGCSNQHLKAVEDKMTESNKKLETIERGFKRLPGFGNEMEPRERMDPAPANEPEA